MFQFVLFHNRPDFVVERIPVCLHSGSGDDSVLGECRALGLLSGHDRVPETHSSVGRNHSVAFSGNGDGGSAVHYVRTPLLSARHVAM